MLGRQRAEPRRQEGDAETVGRADANRAGDGLVAAGEFGACGDHVGFHALGNCEEALAGGRQLAAGGEPAKELCAKRIFQGGDAARNGGVVELQPPRRAEDLASAGHGEKDANVVPVHADPLFCEKSCYDLIGYTISAQRLRAGSRCQVGRKAGQWRHSKKTPGSET